MEWLIKNKEWVFDGFGVAIIAGLIALFFKPKSEKTPKQTQRSGDNSINIQAGGNVHLGDKKNGRDSKTK
jgi:hypothetical protein